MQPHNTLFRKTAAFFPAWSGQYESKDESAYVLWCWYENSNWLQKPHLHRDPGTKVGERQTSASTPRLPALLMLQLSVGKVWIHLPHPSNSLVTTHLSFLPSHPASQGLPPKLKTEGEGIAYLSVQNSLGEEKPFVHIVVF